MLQRFVRVLTVLLFLIKFIPVKGQMLYIPRDIKTAYEKGTRSSDGSPGKKYWQNGANYDIHLSVNPPDRTILGREEITYFNNSPDTLLTVIIHLIQNIHIPEALRAHDVKPEFFSKGIHISSFLINGKKQIWKTPQSNFTSREIRLPEQLLPNDTMIFSFDWQYEITVGEREGIIDSTTFFFAYFYPRIAVYDDYAGWDRNEFNGRQEFYNDFGNYLLNVTVPDNFLVWATGTLENSKEVLQPEIISRLERSMESDDIIHVVSKNDIIERNITNHQPNNIWKWKATYVPDVALGISDHFIWDATSMVADSTRRRVLVEAVYNDTAPDFRHVAAVSKYTLEFLSHKMPGIAYPYPKMTVFQGDYDMEYPMFVNDASYDTYREMQWTTNHEVAHSYFPFYMGTNENRYAFMDEGWATFLEFALELDEMPHDTAVKTFTDYRFKKYAASRSIDVDLPIITPSNRLSGYSYSICAYGKPALATFALQDLLGEKEFKKCLQEYIFRWNGKHPIPYDFFNSFNSSSGKNLDWFWKNWFFSNYHIDLEVKKVEKKERKYIISIANTGGFAVPIDLEIKYTDGSVDKIHKSPVVWYNNQKLVTLSIPFTKNIHSIAFVSELFFNADSTKNKWKY